MLSSSIGATPPSVPLSSFQASTSAKINTDTSETASQIASLLSGALLEKHGSGANIRDPNNHLMGMVADYMDSNPEEFGKPQGTSSWKDELSEDNYLSGKEKNAFNKGLEGLIGDILKGNSQVAPSSTNVGIGNGIGIGIGNGWQNPVGGGVSNSPTALPNTLQELLTSLLAGLAEEKLGGLLTPTGNAARDKRGEVAFSAEDKDVLKEIARFMDMHPEEFGKPDGKSKDWLGELSEGDLFMSRNEGKQFQKAIDMVQGEIKNSASGNSLGGLFPDAERNFNNGGAGNTLKTDASIAADNVLSVIVQQRLGG